MTSVARRSLHAHSGVALAVSALPLGRRATKAAGGAEACTAGTAVAMEREHLLCKLIFHISDVWGRHRSSASAPPRASHSRISNATCDVSHARVGLPIDAYLARPAQYHSAAVQQPHTHTSPPHVPRPLAPHRPSYMALCPLRATRHFAPSIASQASRHSCGIRRPLARRPRPVLDAPEG